MHKQFCEQGRPCAEVLARLVAADRARAAGIVNHPAVGALLRQARRWADLHEHGAGVSR